MREHCVLQNDSRPILSIQGPEYAEGENLWFTLDRGEPTKVTKIEATIDKDGSHWFRIWKGDFMAVAVNRDFVSEIHYVPPSDPPAG